MVEGRGGKLCIVEGDRVQVLEAVLEATGVGVATEWCWRPQSDSADRGKSRALEKRVF